MDSRVRGNDELALEAPSRPGSLERQSMIAYLRPMDKPDAHPPAGWLESLARSEAALAAGQTVSMEAVREGLRQSAARLASKRKKPKQREAARRR